VSRTPSGWKDGGEAFWVKSSAYGQKYKCKTCGCEALGLRYDGEHNHRRDCASPSAIADRERAMLNLFLACLPALRVAGRNLAIAGALRRAYEDGWRNGCEMTGTLMTMLEPSNLTRAAEHANKEHP
jgi:hypothetical protein